MDTLQSNAVKEQVKDFIGKSINIKVLDEDENLFESGIVNSLFSIQLVTFIEKTFKTKVLMEDLDIENFKSIKAVTNFVLSKQLVQAYD